MTPSQLGSGVQQEWVPLEMRSGSLSLQIGPLVMSLASNTTAYDASAFMSEIRVTTYPSSSAVLPTRGATAVSLPKTPTLRVQKGEVSRSVAPEDGVWDLAPDGARSLPGA